MYLEIITRHALASGLELSSFLLNSMVVIMLKFLAQTNVPSLHYCSFRKFSYHFTNKNLVKSKNNNDISTEPTYSFFLL